LKRPLIDDNEYANGATKHLDWVNWVFAITVYLFAVTALQFNSPWKICLLGLPLIILMNIHAILSFPQSLLDLRRWRKEQPENQRLIELENKLEKEFHGWRAALKALPLWISVILYIVVMVSSKVDLELIHWLKT
jgi:hypothetical protein